jgi:hypothetical protein
MHATMLTAVRGIELRQVADPAQIRLASILDHLDRHNGESGVSSFTEPGRTNVA